MHYVILLTVFTVLLSLQYLYWRLRYARTVVALTVHYYSIYYMSWNKNKTEAKVVRTVLEHSDKEPENFIRRIRGLRRVGGQGSLEEWDGPILIESFTQSFRRLFNG